MVMLIYVSFAGYFTFWFSIYFFCGHFYPYCQENFLRSHSLHFASRCSHTFCLGFAFYLTESHKNTKTLRDAGFHILRLKKSSGICIASHLNLSGFLVKLYLSSASFHRSGRSQQKWLIQRCRGAAPFRELIQKKKIRFFTVPEKWLYALPTREGERSLIIIVETYMPLVSKKRTLQALKKRITRQHLRELILFEKRGGAAGPGAFPMNAPYTKRGQFAFIGTEYPGRLFSKRKTKKIGRFFSSSMRQYWVHLVDRSM